jgi:hypothetical protein
LRSPQLGVAGAILVLEARIAGTGVLSIGLYASGAGPARKYALSRKFRAKRENRFNANHLARQFRIRHTRIAVKRSLVGEVFDPQ